MTNKHSSTNRAAEPPRIDDLKLINGIGPAVERRLNVFGIFTFIQLAALSPADIAAAVASLAGLSAERIIKQDWIGQARKLAAETTSSEAQKDVESATEPLAPIEYARSTTTLVEPLQARKLAPEPISSEGQEAVESSEDTEQVEKLQAPFEQAPPIELTHAVSPLEEPQRDTQTMSSKEQFHPATFTVELTLDENNNVNRTHVLHVQSRREHTWSDWPGADLLDFLGQRSGINLTSGEPALANAEEPEQVPALITESESPTSVAARPALAGTLHLRDMKILTTGSSEPCRSLLHDQPFDVRLTLDLSELTVPANTSLDYKAIIYRKSRSDPAGEIVVETEGTIEPANRVTIDVAGNSLVVGSYRLATTVILALPGAKPTLTSNCRAEIEGGRVRIY